MRRDLAAGTGKKIYDDYIQVIERYLVPFFGERHLQTLKHKDIAEFEVWRNAKMGRRPKSSTLMTYASAFTRVCKTATERGWLSESVVLPLMSRKGEKGTVRPAFSAEEVVALRSAIVGWQSSGRTAEDNDFRQLLCDYVEFLLLTGARHGTLPVSRLTLYWADTKVGCSEQKTGGVPTASTACFVVCYDTQTC